MTGRPLRIVVLGPHFEPDTAPTGRVLTRIVEELAARGHELHVVAALPWYRAHAIEPGWGGRLIRREATRVGLDPPGPPVPGRRQAQPAAPRRRASPASRVLAGWAGLGAGGWCRRVDAVIAMSPPLTMGLTGRLVAWSHRAPQVFNIQDVFPDAAVETGAITDRRVIAVAGVARAAQLPPRRRRDGALRRPPRQRRGQGPRRPVGDGAHDPQLRRHRPHPARRPDDAVPRRARHRRRAGRAVRRQRRVLAVARPARSRPPGGCPT